MTLARDNRGFQDNIRDAQSKRQGNMSMQVVNVPARQIVDFRVAATELLFMFDALYPHPGGENDFQLRINNGSWLSFLIPPAPPWEMSDFAIYQITFWNKTAAAREIRFITMKNPMTTEGGGQGGQRLGGNP